MVQELQSRTQRLKGHFTYMWLTHWAFDKLFLLVLSLQVLTHVGASLLTLVLPRIVLDRLVLHDNLQKLLIHLSGLTLALAFLKMMDVKLKTIIEERAWKFFYFFGYATINHQRMVLDYERYASPQGKTLAQKALRSVSGYTFSSLVAYMISMKDMILNIFGLMSFSLILAALHPLVLLFLLLPYIINSAITVWVEGRRHQYREEEASIWRRKRYFSLRTCLVQYAKDIRIYSLAKWLQRLREELLDRELNLTEQQERLSLIQVLIQGLLIVVRDGLAYTFLIHRMISRPDMTIGEFSLYLGAIIGFSDWLSELVEAFQTHVEARHFVEDYRTFFEHDNDRSGDKMVASPLELVLEDVSYTYPDTDVPVLENINLTLKPGEKLALVGMNGAGKSTLVKLICGLIRPTQGRILMNGQPIDSISRSVYFEQFGVVFQEVTILPVTIAQNVTLKHRLTQAEVALLWEVLTKAGLSEKVRAMPAGIDTMLLKSFNEEGVDLSGGERQKLLLARALYKDAPILILDEPTAALDPIAENELYLKYHELTEDKSSIYISHRLSSTYFCDRIVVLDHAQIVEEGTHQELLSLNGVYAELFEASSQYYREEDAV